MKRVVLSVLVSSLLVACNGGGGSSSSGSSWVEDITPASPNPASGSYNGVPYSQLGQPVGLTQSYPSSFLPNNLQIAYGNNSESQIANLTAYVNMTGELCSATPIKYDSVSNTTFLIGAAHCFVDAKDSANTLSATNLKPVGSLSVAYGVNASSAPVESRFQVVATYLPQTYCYGSTFVSGGSCTNFSPNSGSGTQGNDISVIQISGKYADPESYPQLATAAQYPMPYTMAPILSIGYGINTQSPLPNPSASCGTSDKPCGTMFYVANYQYWQQDATGYHYLYNSYYNNSYQASPGYTSLICGGDSGGGDLFWNGSNWLLLSEHTYGPSGACGTFYSYLPNGATNVSAYYDWIQSILTDANPIADCKSGTIANCVTNGN